MNVRPPDNNDVADIALILDDTELFPSSMLTEMVQPFFNDSDNSERWLVYEDDGKVIGFCYFRAEPLTEGTWNLLAIGFRKGLQGRGHGAAFIDEIERTLTGERLLIVETSSLAEYESTRAFYSKCGYHQEASIRDYWAAGDDKIIFSKTLI